MQRVVALEAISPLRDFYDPKTQDTIERKVSQIEYSRYVKAFKKTSYFKAIQKLADTIRSKYGNKAGQDFNYQEETRWVDNHGLMAVSVWFNNDTSVSNDQQANALNKKRISSSGVLGIISAYKSEAKKIHPKCEIFAYCDEDVFVLNNIYVVIEFHLDWIIDELKSGSQDIPSDRIKHECAILAQNLYKREILAKLPASMRSYITFKIENLDDGAISALEVDVYSYSENDVEYSVENLRQMINTDFIEILNKEMTKKDNRLNARWIGDEIYELIIDEKII